MRYHAVSGLWREPAVTMTIRIRFLLCARAVPKQTKERLRESNHHTFKTAKLQAPVPYLGSRPSECIPPGVALVC